ncbi:MAG: aminoacyl--tRNA ligase-related protein [Blastocatellia bacterium]
MTDKALLDVKHGLATLGPGAIRIRELLEARFLGWAADCNATKMLFPPLMSVEDLSKLDYFRNFPHLALVVSRIREENLQDDYSAAGDIESISNSHMATGEYVLPSAACYNAYIFLRGTTLEEPTYITTVASCFRNEVEYKGLQRLWGFSMREIICVGPIEAVQSHLGEFKQRILQFANQIELPLNTQVATDPFYQTQSARTLMQQLFPVKEEFVYGESVAIASVNFHRNFFGERCSITMANGQAAFSGCVAFGIERWIHALLEHFGGDVDLITKTLAR